MTHRPPLMQLDVPRQDRGDPRHVDAHQVESEADGDEGDGDGEDEELPIAAVYSADELLRERDFARFGPDELRRARVAGRADRDGIAAPPIAAEPGRRTTAASSTSGGRCTRRCAPAGIRSSAPGVRRRRCRAG